MIYCQQSTIYNLITSVETRDIPAQLTYSFSRVLAWKTKVTSMMLQTFMVSIAVQSSATSFTRHLTRFLYTSSGREGIAIFNSLIVNHHVTWTWLQSAMPLSTQTLLWPEVLRAKKKSPMETTLLNKGIWITITVAHQENHRLPAESRKIKNTKNITTFSTGVCRTPVVNRGRPRREQDSQPEIPAG